MKVSVIVPSRLAVNPASKVDNLYLVRSLMSAKPERQTAKVDVELIVGIDPGSAARVPAVFSDVQFVELAGRMGQASALNAAARHASGDVLAFLEDDDYWQPEKLATQLPLLEHFDLVTCNQYEVDDWGNFIRYNNFPTPSGWLMRRETWERSGGFDELFRWHVDTEWLGRANKEGLKRVHVVHGGVDQDDFWLKSVREHSDVLVSENLTVPLVVRTRNPDGGMATIERDPEAAAQSRKEHEIMRERFGGRVPW